MKKFFLLLLLLFMIMPAGGQLEVHQGFPLGTGSNLRVNIVAADIDGDGILDLIVTPENRVVRVFNSTGVLKWENVSGMILSDYARTPVVRNFTGDQRPEVLTYGNPYYSNATLYIWDPDGMKLVETQVGVSILISPPSVTQDGVILTGAAPGTSFSPILNFSGLHALDTGGNFLWYLELGNKTSFFASMPLADIDDDGEEEAILLTHDTGVSYPTDGRVWAIDVNRTKGTVLWSNPLYGDAGNAAVGDLNGDGRMEIVVVSSGGAYIFDGNGSQISNFTINTNNAIPAIGDVDRDGMNDVVVASNSDRKIYIISRGSLQEFTTTGRISSNVAIGDINRDGNIELAGGDIYGYIYVWDRAGTELVRQKVSPTNDYFTSALITDLEKDGQKELIYGNYDGNIYAFTYVNLSAETAPPVTADNVDGIWHNSSVTVTLTASDPGSGVAATHYTADGTIPTSGSPIGNIITLTRDRIYTIRYFSVDNVGNTEDVRTAANRVMIDTVKPFTIDDADNLWHNGSAGLNLTASDNFSGVALLHYRVDGIENVSSRSVSLVFTGDGVHSIEYYATDIAGNYESQKSASVRIDASPPITTDDVDGLWHNSNVTVRLQPVDNLSGVNATYNKVNSVPQSALSAFISWAVSVTGQAPGYSESNNTTISNEGVYNVSYFSTDNVGNIEPEKTSKMVKIDRTPPALVVTSPQNRTYSSSETITLNFSASDSLSGVKSMNGSVDGVRNVSSGELVDMAALGAGGHEFYLESRDNAGNLNGQTIYFSVGGTFVSETGYINGSLIDNVTKAGISGARVFANASVSTITDPAGYYSLRVSPGIYNIIAVNEPVYHANSSVSVSVSAGTTTMQDIEMIKKPTGIIMGNVKNI